MAKEIDLGHMDSTEDMCVTSKQRKRKKNYPSVWVRKANLPLSPADVGKTIKISGTIHVTGIEESTDVGRGNSKEYRFELRSMAIHNSRAKLKGALKNAGS